MLTNELLPRAEAATRGGHQIMTTEIAANGDMGAAIAELQQLALNATLAPARVLPSRAHDQLVELALGAASCRRGRLPKAAHFRRTSSRCQRRSVSGLGRSELEPEPRGTRVNEASSRRSAPSKLVGVTGRSKRRRLSMPSMTWRGGWPVRPAIRGLRRPPVAYRTGARDVAVGRLLRRLYSLAMLQGEARICPVAGPVRLRWETLVNWSSKVSEPPAIGRTEPPWESWRLWAALGMVMALATALPGPR